MIVSYGYGLGEDGSIVGFGLGNSEGDIAPPTPTPLSQVGCLRVSWKQIGGLKVEQIKDQYCGIGKDAEDPDCVWLLAA